MKQSNHPDFQAWNRQIVRISLYRKIVLRNAKKRGDERRKKRIKKLRCRKLRHGEILEASPGFEPGNEGFADLCLTTWL